MLTFQHSSSKKQAKITKNHEKNVKIIKKCLKNLNCLYYFNQNQFIIIYLFIHFFNSIQVLNILNKLTDVDFSTFKFKKTSKNHKNNVKIIKKYYFTLATSSAIILNCFALFM